MSTISPRFPVGLEEGDDGSTAVHAFTLPGCIATGGNPDLALDAFGSALTEWLTFLQAIGEAVPPREAEIEVVVEEWIRTHADVAGSESDVCFDGDRTPLEVGEIVRGLRMLGALRSRLLPFIRRAPDEVLEATGAPDWNARMILNELARAQWWTLTRLGASPLAEVPERTVARLDTAMALVVQRMGNLDEESRRRTILLEGEEWTARRVLRRMLWLEWTLGGAALDLLGAPALAAP